MIKLVKQDIDEINRRVREDPSGLVRECESAYAAQIRDAAASVVENMEKSPVVLLSGPSGSGKTTTAYRLQQELETLGVITHTVSMDDYFNTVDPKTSPRTPEGDIDFESPDCLDMELLNEHFGQLAAGQEIRIPRYIFSRQKRSASTYVSLRLRKNEIAIFEGIHALNSAITGPHPEALRIYVSASMEFLKNGSVGLRRTWLRLARRVVRDHSFRGADACFTIELWPNVLRGERLYIDPYKDSAHIQINSAMAYEPSVLRDTAGPLLSLPKPSSCSPELVEIRDALALFESMDPSIIPSGSLLREFIGGSRYNYS